MSGRRRNSSSGVPIFWVAGNVGSFCTVDSCVISDSGEFPIKTPKRRMLRVMDDSISGMVARVADNWACAREVSS
jgi:hypothetical protein